MTIACYSRRSRAVFVCVCVCVGVGCGGEEVACDPADYLLAPSLFELTNFARLPVFPCYI